MTTPPQPCSCGAAKDPRAARCRTCFERRDEGPTRACTGCGDVRPTEDFAWRPNGRGGQKRRSKCRSCEAAYARDHRHTDPDRHAAAKRDWEARNRERVMATRLRAAARKLGLDPDVIEAHFAEHHGRCDICGGESRQNTRLSIDHDHATGRFRGLLCSDCNLGLGKLGDNAEGLRRALRYLEDA